MKTNSSGSKIKVLLLITGSIAAVRIPLLVSQLVKENYEILESVEKDFGVSKFYVASIIGCETNYGSFLGTYNPLDTIFTRAFEPKNNFWQK